jgi:hypothetical protein
VASAKVVAKRARRVTEKTAANPVLEILERAGYVLRGVLYAVMGTLALGLATGVGGTATDPSGSLVIITPGLAGKVLLVAVVVGLGAYAIWGFVRALFDPLRRGDNATGLAERLGFAWSGFAYSGIVLFALELLAGHPKSPHQDAVQTNIAHLLGLPAGQILVIGIGIVALGVGLGQFATAMRAPFKQDMKRSEMKKEQKKVVDALGRLGMFSRGVTFSLIGWFLIQGGLHHDPSQVHGYGGAFVYLLGEPFGRFTLGLVALGFIALGLHSFACARWIRMLGDSK